MKKIYIIGILVSHLFFSPHIFAQENTENSEKIKLLEQKKNGTLIKLHFTSCRTSLTILNFPLYFIISHPAFSFTNMQVLFPLC